MTNIIFCQLGGLFFALIPPNQPKKSKFWKTEKSNQRYNHFTHMSHKWHSYDVWFLRYEAWQTKFFVSLDCFFPFYPSNNQKNQNFEKLKKNPGDIIILHKCPKNHDHMLYYSWDMARNGWNCYSLKFLWNEKKTLEISSFYICVPKIMIRRCTVPEIWCVIDGQTDR